MKTGHCTKTARNAGAERDRSDVDVAVVDVPAFFAGIRGSAAGEGGHASIVPPI
jgi:hypothetical protein